MQRRYRENKALQQKSGKMTTYQVNGVWEKHRQVSINYLATRFNVNIPQIISPWIKNIVNELPGLVFEAVQAR